MFSINFYSQSQNENSKSLEAIKIDSEEITLDGRLDEPFWAVALKQKKVIIIINLFIIKNLV